MRILNDRLKFGLILDDYTNILLLNHYLQNGNLRDAAKSAILMMLQEEYDVPIAKEMAMYATYKYILSLKNQALVVSSQQLIVHQKLKENFYWEVKQCIITLM